HRRAARQRAALEHAYAQSGARQIEGANEPVVACAYENCIVLACAHSPGARAARSLSLQPGAGARRCRASGIRLRIRLQKRRSATSVSLRGPAVKVAEAMPSCTRRTSAVSSALT